jgi:hypothetical protein
VAIGLILGMVLVGVLLVGIVPGAGASDRATVSILGLAALFMLGAALMARHHVYHSGHVPLVAAADEGDLT